MAASHQESEIQLWRLKAQLEKQLAQLQDSGLEESMAESVEELSTYDNHPADLGSEMYERTKDIALREQTRQQLLEINQAIQRLAAGNYGCCQDCGGPISPGRLSARPQTSYCIDCQMKQERSSGWAPHPNEIVLPPASDDAWQVVSHYGTSSGLSPEDQPLEDDDQPDPVDNLPTYRGEDGMIYQDFSPVDQE